MDYEEIKVEDLVMDESFQQYCLGSSLSAQTYWENWLTENPHRKTDFLKAKQLVFILNGNHSAVTFEKDKAAFLRRLKTEGIIKEAPLEAKVVEMPSGGGRSGIRLLRLSAAAILVGIIVTASFLVFRKENAEQPIARQKTKEVQSLDRYPGGNKATLTLADGTTIVLDSASNGLLSQQGSAKVIKVGDLLTYENGQQGSEVLYNTIETPRGGQYQLLLSDGSKVWLNALSSLRFPSIFKGNERNVELHGEGYFEIAHNPSKPFHVTANDVVVEVLGTHFNVMAYPDEAVQKTTLVEGRVKVKRGGGIVLLEPGQQAKVYQEGTMQLDKNPNIEEELAWKNGLFQFSGADVGTILRQIERWYNVETMIKGDMRNIHLSGKVSRNLNLAQVIEVLEASGIDIRSEGTKLVASPKP